MSPWTVYWVMQMDSLRAALGALIAACALGLLATGMIAAFQSDEKTLSLKQSQRYRRTATVLLAVIVVLTVAVGALPSTRSAAAIVVLPAIVNSPSVQAEAKELYEIAKEGLRRAVGPSDQPAERPDTNTRK